MGEGEANGDWKLADGTVQLEDLYNMFLKTDRVNELNIIVNGVHSEKWIPRAEILRPQFSILVIVFILFICFNLFVMFILFILFILFMCCM